MFSFLRYLICAGAYTSGQFQLTQRLFGASLAFYKSSKKDVCGNHLFRYFLLEMVSLLELYAFFCQYQFDCAIIIVLV